MSIFEKASRQKLTFATVKGVLTTQDIWDLPLTSKSGVSLDSIATSLYRELKDEGEVSFVKSASTSKRNPDIQLKFDIVRHIIEVRETENEQERLRKNNADEKQRLLALLDKRNNEALESLSAEEIQKRLDALK